LLIACDATHAEAAVRRIAEDGYAYARMIGYVEHGPSEVKILD
jgi:hypothetical protein